MNKNIQYLSFKTFSASASMLLGLFSTHVNAAWVDLGSLGSTFAYHENFNLDDSDYVSEENIASNSLTFTLTSSQTVNFFADTFKFTNGKTELRQIDILDANKISGVEDGDAYVGGIGSYDLGLNGQAPNFSYLLGPGDYQINYKVRGQEVGYTSDRVVGTAATGLGSYYLGFSIGGAGLPGPIAGPSINPVPEPETYAMLLAGLLLIGFSVRRKHQI